MEEAKEVEGLPFDTPEDAPEFDGDYYDHGLDHQRLGAQCLCIWLVMSDGIWRSLGEIEDVTGFGQASHLGPAQEPSETQVRQP